MSSGVSNRFDPIGVRYIISVIEKNNHDVLFLQNRLVSRGKILDNIKESKADLLWLSVQPDTEDLLDFMQKIKKIYNGIIIVGNIGSRWITENDLKMLDANIIIVSGQGEDATKQLIQLYNNSTLSIKTIKEIANVRGCFKGVCFETFKSKFVNNDNILPSTNDLKGAIERKDIITVRTSSGCNFHCTYCSVKDINNGQSWKLHSKNILYKNLENIVSAGMRVGTIRFIDDDTAVSLKHLLELSIVFKDINSKHNTKLTFGFATNAVHLYDSSETTNEAMLRLEVWRKVVENGLTDLFLGLESGSSSQLKRFGKNNNSETNYKAYDIAKNLNINLEIGFIPIDPLMQDNIWKNEFLDNIRLAKYIDVANTSPTWLSTIRVYENSPLKKALTNNKLLGSKMNESNEYNFAYKSAQVIDFINDLGICLCDDTTTNGLYQLKRELKNIIRYNIQHSQEYLMIIAEFSKQLSSKEFEFVEGLIDKENQSTLSIQLSFIVFLIKSCDELLLSLRYFTEEQYFKKIRLSIGCAINSAQEWKRKIEV